MKLIVAIIPTHKMEDVIHALDEIKIFRKTVSHVLGVGQSHTEVYRGMHETGNLVRKIRFDIAVSEEKVESTIQAIIKGAENEAGDGKIFILDINDCIELGSNKRGPEAIGQ